MRRISKAALLLLAAAVVLAGLVQLMHEETYAGPAPCTQQCCAGGVISCSASLACRASECSTTIRNCLDWCADDCGGCPPDPPPPEE